MMMGPTKQISRDDVERVCDDYPWVNYADRRKALNMLRSLMNELEEVKQDRDDMTTAARSLNADVTDLGKKLAAANERGQVIENDMEMALLLLEQAEPPKENDDDQEWAATVGSLASAYRGD